MNVFLICTTYNRDRCLQRALRFFIEQDYKGNHTLLVFNSGEPTSLPELNLPENKKIILVNRSISIETGKEYTSIGEKNRDALSYCSEADIISHADVDDIFLFNHISEGVKGMQKAYELNKLAYKPKFSYFKGYGTPTLQENVFEPSIFIDSNYLRNKGYFDLNVKYHDKWLFPLIESDKILVDPIGEPTFCYDWSGQIPVYKMSSKEDHQAHFYMSQNNEKDKGNGITNPISLQEYNKLCSKIKSNKNASNYN